MTQVYAKVENGVVTVYPIDIEHLTSSAANLDLYHPVDYSEKPVIAKWMYLIEEPIVAGDRVQVTYRTQFMDLRDMLTVCRGKGGQPSVEDLGLDFIARLKDLSIPVLRAKVTEFVRTNPWYGTIEAAMADALSNIPEARLHGEYTTSVMETLRRNIDKYFDDISSSKTPLPASMDDLIQLVPTLHWSKNNA